jgi:hypothetical protein
MVQGLFAVIAASAAVAASGGAATSADGRRAAPVGDFPVVALTGPSQMVDLGNNGPVDGLAWLSGGRLAVATGLDSILHVLEPSGVRSARWELKGETLAVVGVGARAVVLLAPVRRLGRAWLAVVDPGRPPRRVALPGVRAGYHPSNGFSPDMRTPALVVLGGRVVVIGDRGAIVVDPATGHRSTHRVAGLRPVPQRTAFPVDGGRRIAVAGRDLLYVDPRRWRARRIAAAVDYAEPWRTGVLVTRRRAADGYDGAGRRVFHRRLRVDEYVTVTPDRRRILLGRFDRNGVDAVRTLDP